MTSKTDDNSNLNSKTAGHFGTQHVLYVCKTIYKQVINKVNTDFEMIFQHKPNDCKLPMICKGK